MALEEAFAGTIWEDMGARFLRCFLASFADQPTGVAYAYLCGTRVVGLVVGAEDARQHRTECLRRRWRGLAFHGTIRAITHPRLLRRLLPYARPYVTTAWERLLRACRLSGGARPTDTDPGGSVPPVERAVGAPAAPAPADGAIPPASLILLGVARDHRGRGVGEHLTRLFLEDMAARGVRQVKLVVGAENVPALKVYRETGWVESGEFPKPEGGSALRLIYDLEAAARRESLLARDAPPTRCSA